MITVMPMDILMQRPRVMPSRDTDTLTVTRVMVITITDLPEVMTTVTLMVVVVMATRMVQ